MTRSQTPWNARCLDLAGISDPLLRRDFETCRALFARHGRTYYSSTLLLPAAQRPWVWALYGFARYGDQLIDDPVTASPQRLQAWSADVLVALYSSQPSATAVTRAAVHTIRAKGIEPGLLQRFLESMQMDASITQYETYADLEHYMAGSAAAIGLWMLPILRPVSPAATQPAQRLGEAFQLTNFIRDVAEDLDRGRIYLPMEDLARFGVDRDLLLDCRAQARSPARVANLIAFESERARALYREAEPGIELLHPASRPAIRAAWVLYQEILDVVAAQSHDVFTTRATVNRSRRLGIFAKARWHLATAPRSADRNR